VVLLAPGWCTDPEHIDSFLFDRNRLNTPPLVSSSVLEGLALSDQEEDLDESMGFRDYFLLNSKTNCFVRFTE
jgi:hypothetical protein